MFQPLLFALQLAVAAPGEGASLPSPSPILPPPSGWSTFWWGDYDADGLADAWVVRAGGQGRLLRNGGDGNFEDVTDRTGLKKIKEAHMALWADFDGDERLDLFLAAWNQPSSLLRQSAPGTFTEVTRESGLGEATHVVDAEWRDYDGDGALDLHLTTLEEEVLVHNRGGGRLERVVLELPKGVPFLERYATPLTPDDARRQRGLAPVGPGGMQETTSAPGLSGSSTGAGGATAASGAAICASTLEDFATGVCIPASSVPTLGMFYPLSSELFVDAGTGRVGVGTTAPGAQLDVAGGDVRTTHRFVSTASSGAPLVVNSSTLVSNLNADKLDGFDATAFSQLGSSIETSEISTGAVTNIKIAVGAVDSSSVRDETLTALDLATDSVRKEETAPNSVGTSEIVDDSIGALDLGADSVGTSEIAASSVTGSEIAAGTIVNGHVSSTAAIAGTKLVPDFGNQALSTRGSGDFGGNGVNTRYSVRAENGAGPNQGYLGVLGADNYDGISSADWNGREIGIAGISTDASFTDNYAILGHSNGVGVRGENATSPASNYAELGLDGVGLRTAGTDYAADLNGAVDITAATAAYPAFVVNQSGSSRAGAFFQDNLNTPNVSLFASSNSADAGHSTLRALHTGGGAGGAMTIESTDPANTGTNSYIFNAGTGSALVVESEDMLERSVQFSRSLTSHVIGNDMLQIDVLGGSSTQSQFIECERGGDVEFRVDGDGDVLADGAFTGPADFAEMIAVSTGAASVQAGDVVVIDPGASRSVRLSSQPYSTLVAGVYSTKPGFVGSERDFTESSLTPGHEGKALKREDMALLHDEVPIAVVGIVPCKVSVENGPILPGTMLVTSSTPGYAMGDANPPVGTVVGKALEAFDGTLGRVGTIRILVTLQ